MRKPAERAAIPAGGHVHEVLVGRIVMLWRVTALTSREKVCMRRYVSLLYDRLGEDLIDVILFGSAARGEMWPPSSPMHSDIDLLVLTRAAVSEVEEDA